MTQQSANYYIGIMSGTSLDAIDVALVSIENHRTRFVAGVALDFDAKLRKKLLELCQIAHCSLQELGELTVQLSLAYAKAVNELLAKNALTANEIVAIGCHGQTVFHQPSGNYPFSMQLLNASVLATNTNIDVVSDFRSKDLALGGQGAPLVPPFHQSLVGKSHQLTVFANIGGIANLSVVAEQLTGFDTGPGNVLIDSWMQQKFQLAYDKNGQLASNGKVCEPLLDDMLTDSYFQLLGPKSSGREYFNLSWLDTYLSQYHGLSNEDVLATLVELTAVSLTKSLVNIDKGRLLLCGGGVNNLFLVRQISKLLPNWQVTSTAEIEVDPNYMEAMAFAWLAYRTLAKQTANCIGVTGASKEAILGQITYHN